MVLRIKTALLAVSCLLSFSSCVSEGDEWDLENDELDTGHPGIESLNETVNTLPLVTPYSVKSFGPYTTYGYASGMCKSASDFDFLVTSAARSAISSWEGATGCRWDYSINRSSEVSPRYFSGSGWYYVSIRLTGTPGIFPPENLNATVRGSNVNVSWSPSSGATGYKLYLNDVYQYSTSSTFWNISGLEPETQYTVSVSAYIKAGDTEKSNFSFVTTGLTVPVSISGPSVLTGSISPEWRVNIPSSITNYVFNITVQRGSEPPFTWQSTNPVISFSPGVTGQMLRITVTVTAPPYSPGTATHTCLNAYGM